MESFEDRYIKPSDVPDIIWELSAGYLLNLKEMIQELNLGEDSFQLSCYEVCFQNQWGVRGVEFYFFYWGTLAVRERFVVIHPMSAEIKEMKRCGESKIFFCNLKGGKAFLRPLASRLV